MHNIGLVAKHAIQMTVRKRSFWIMTFIVPAFLFAFQVYNVTKESGAGNTGNPSESQSEKAESPTPAELPAIGLVDEAGIINRFPSQVPPDLFVRYTDSNSARAALESRQIEQYIYLPADYLASGQVTVYARDFKITSSGEDIGPGSSNEWILSYLINYNLTGDEQLITALLNPTPGQFTEYHVMQPPVSAGTVDPATALVISRLMPYLFYFILIIGSSYLLQSVTAEKENRTAEVLLLSVNPREFMAGKVIGLGVVTLIQLLVWLGGGYVLLQGNVAGLNLSAYKFPPSFFLWAVLFLVLGYLVYGGIMAVGGAIAPNAREGNQITVFLILPLLPTLMFASEFAKNPHGVLPIVLSLFPLSAPSAMVTRLAVVEVPTWQLFVSLGGLVATAYGFIILAGHFFRADNLLSDASFSWRRLLTGWRSS